jgi:signal transduction histidine kinase
LANIRDRVEALHGRLTIESRPGAGTSVRAELPLATSGLGQ